MARITEPKHIQKFHTEEQMRRALQDFIDRKARLRVPVDDDDPDIVLSDAINELLEAREIVRAVGETDSTCYVDDSGGEIKNSGETQCPYCGNVQMHQHMAEDLDFVHAPDCIVTKARKLLDLSGKE